MKTKYFYANDTTGIRLSCRNRQEAKKLTDVARAKGESARVVARTIILK